MFRGLDLSLLHSQVKLSLIPITKTHRSLGRVFLLIKSSVQFALSSTFT